MATFREHGVAFPYPDNWTVERDALDAGWTATVQSPATAFFTVALREDDPDPAALADATRDAVCEEYKECDAEPALDTVAGRPAVGYDLRFFSLDLTNTCRIRCLSTDGGTLLLLAQANDAEETNERVLHAMRVALTLDEP